MALSFLSWLFAILIFLPGKSRACNVNAIRLAGGQNRFEGRVEVCHNGQWKRVCIYGWFDQEANVVCRQLGFSGNLNPVEERYTVRFGQGSGEVLRVFWNCQGTEKFLLDCPTLDANFCNNPHHFGAGVYCFGKVSRQCTDGEITLENGHLLEGSGRVEVCLDGLWGTVCDDGWDSNDATTVCRQLGYNNPRGIPTRGAYFGEGSGPIHLSRAQCSSRDTRLTNCDVDRTGINGCDHSEDAGVICMGPSSCGDGDIRLVGGEGEREGRVEICYSGVWGTVCDYGWDEVDANVICRQLGYGQSTIAIPVLKSGTGDGPVLLNNVSCNQNSTELSQCVHPLSIGIHNCNKSHTAGVKCQRIISPSKSTAQSTSELMHPLSVHPLSIGIHNCNKSRTAGVKCQRIISPSRSTAQSTSVLMISTSLKQGYNNSRSTASDDSVFLMQTRAETVIITPTVRIPHDNKGLLTIIIVAIGIALAMGNTAIIVVVSVVVIKRQREKKRRAQDNNVAGKGSPNRQACNIGIVEGPLATVAREDEREFQNPLYGTEMDTNITSLASIQNIYEGLHGSTRNSEHLYDQTADYYSVPRSLINGWSYANGGDVKDHHVTTSEAIYDVPPASDVSDHDYDECFPELDTEGPMQ